MVSKAWSGSKEDPGFRETKEKTDFLEFQD